jgi:transcriptional regulator with XRE-family HTH domain
MEGGSPTVRRRRLGRTLRDLRIRAGLSGNAAGAAVERSGSWISRVESGRVGLRGLDLRPLLDLYGVHDQQRRDELEGLAREGKQRGWWSRYSDSLPEAFIVFVGLEAAAQSIR